MSASDAKNGTVNQEGMRIKNKTTLQKSTCLFLLFALYQMRLQIKKSYVHGYYGSKTVKTARRLTLISP